MDGSLIAKIEGGRIRPYEGQLRRLATTLRWPARDGTGLLDDVPADAAVGE